MLAKVKEVFSSFKLLTKSSKLTTHFNLGLILSIYFCCSRKIKDLDPKIIKESCENSNLQFKITKKEKELGSLQEKVKEMHTINEGLKTDIELVDCQEVNDKLICICSVQKK